MGARAPGWVARCPGLTTPTPGDCRPEVDHAHSAQRCCTSPAPATTCPRAVHTTLACGVHVRQRPSRPSLAFCPVDQRAAHRRAAAAPRLAVVLAHGRCVVGVRWARDLWAMGGLTQVSLKGRGRLGGCHRPPARLPAPPSRHYRPHVAESAAMPMPLNAALSPHSHLTAVKTERHPARRYSEVARQKCMRCKGALKTLR